MSINKNYSNKPKVQASHTHSNKPIREALHILNEMSLYVRHDKKKYCIESSAPYTVLVAASSFLFVGVIVGVAYLAS